MKRILCILLAVLTLLCVIPVSASAEEPDGRELKILFTHDIHSYFITSQTQVGGKVTEHGGAARLKTLIDRNRDENTLYFDAGDFSQGTLLQAGYAENAYELRLLGLLGCDATTFGNHEFDLDGTGAAKMLRSAKASGDPLPQFVQSNIDFSGELTDEQKDLRTAMEEYGAKEYLILEKNGLKIAVFGLLGIDGIECSPTSGMKFENYVEAAKRVVQKIRLGGEADVIVCLSHSGTNGDGKSGEDVTLAKKVPGIDVIVSGHTHTTYEKPVTVGKTLIVSAGEYLTNLGSLTLNVTSKGVEYTDYRLIPCDGTVEEDPAVAAILSGFESHIESTYLADEGIGFNDVIAHCNFNFMPLGEMYETHQEYPMGNLIADSYLYEARRNGIEDIDVALVGLGTIRGSFSQGDITVAEAFEMCSLGVGGDGTAGHPLVGAYITGKELKLLVELDASLGPLVSSIKMSYAGLRYTFNTKRMSLDRVTEVFLVRPDGSEEKIENGKLYKVVANMYAVNMLGMLNGLTKGILSITPKDADGYAVDDFYACALKNTDGKEIKEWVALKNYLSSLPKENGVPTIPASYASQEGRKAKVSEGGFSVLKNPGGTTVAVIVIPVIFAALIVLLVLGKKRRKKKKARS